MPNRLTAHGDRAQVIPGQAAQPASHTPLSGGEQRVAASAEQYSSCGVSSILTTGLEAWRRVQEVNLTSVYLRRREVLGHMRRQGRGAIINTASFVVVMGSASELTVNEERVANRYREN